MTRARLLALDAPVALWLVDGGAEPDAAQVAQLQPEERARAARFRSDERRRRYLAAHVALRDAVAERCGVPPARQRYALDVSGQWRLVGETDWRLSLSYSGTSALIGVARGGAVGVDVEAERTIEDADDLAAEHFDPGERACYRRLTGAERDAAFLRGWTRKEACLKAIGLGLSLPPACVGTGLDGVRRVRVHGRALHVGSFRVGDLIGAWALERPAQ